MTRLLVLVLLAVVLWLILEAAWARLRIAVGVSARPLRPTAPAPPPPPITETLVRCAGCGVHVPGKSMAGGLCERCSPHPRPQVRRG
jgi:hypothetical protein